MYIVTFKPGPIDFYDKYITVNTIMIFPLNFKINSKYPLDVIILM